MSDKDCQTSEVCDGGQCAGELAAVNRQLLISHMDFLLRTGTDFLIVRYRYFLLCIPAESV